MLVTPLRDGMNLVAKEVCACSARAMFSVNSLSQFVASRNDERGVLVLSEFAGAAVQLREALRVNPCQCASAFDVFRCVDVCASLCRCRRSSHQTTLRLW